MRLCDYVYVCALYICLYVVVTVDRYVCVYLYISALLCHPLYLCINLFVNVEVCVYVSLFVHIYVCVYLILGLCLCIFTCVYVSVCVGNIYVLVREYMYACMCCMLLFLNINCFLCVSFQLPSFCSRLCSCM